ncbi:hypothetical protein [Cupriavidus sp. CP313]
MRDRLDMVLIESARPVSAAIVMRIGIGARLGLASSALGRACLYGRARYRFPQDFDCRLAGSNWQPVARPCRRP